MCERGSWREFEKRSQVNLGTKQSRSERAGMLNSPSFDLSGALP